jgi:hypothetical protein
METMRTQKSYLSLLFFILFAIITTLTISAQERTVSGSGTKTDLNGVERISIETGKDSKSRERIIKEIRRQLPNLTIVSTGEEGDVTLIYRNEFLQIAESRQTEQPRRSFDPKEKYYQTVSFREEAVEQPVAIKTGAGYVLKINDNNSGRLLLNFQSERLSNKPDRDPAMTFAQTFIKAYREANQGNNWIASK